MRFGNNVSDSELLSLGNDFQSVNGLDEYHARRLVYLKRLDPNPNRYSREQCIELIHSDNRRILEQQAQIPPPAPYPSAPNAPYPGQQGQNVYEYNPSAPYPGGPGNNNPYPNQGNAYPNQGGNAYPPSDPYPQGPAMSDRERERAMRQAERQRERLERQTEREREMAERQRERLERQAERERERLERQAERERLRSGRGKGRIASVPLAEGTCTQATTMAIIMDTMATIMDTNLRKCHSLCLLLGVGRRPFSLESTTKGNRTNSKVASWTRSVRAILRARTLSLSFG